MRKIILLAVAGYLWRKYERKTSASGGRVSRMLTRRAQRAGLV